MYKKWSFVALVLLLAGILILGSFGCGKPSPAPAPTPTPTAKQAPAPAPTKPVAPTSPKPAPAASPKPAATTAAATQIPPPGAAPIKVTYAGGMPAKTLLTDGMEMFKKLVEERSKGVVTVELYPAGQLFTHPQMPKAIESAAVSMACCDPTQWSGTAPVVSTCYVQAGFASIEQAVKLCGLSPFFKIFDSELNRNKAKLLGWTYYGGGDGVISKDPIRKVADLSGKRLRVMGEIIALYWKELGASAVVVDSAEAYTALQTGTINAAYSGLDTFVNRKWMEPAKNVILPPNFGAFQKDIFIVVWNQDKWNALPSWAQKLFTDCQNEVYQWQLVDGKKRDMQNVETLKSNGVNIYCIPEAEWPEWANHAKSSWDYLASKDKENGAEILKLVEQAKAAK